MNNFVREDFSFSLCGLNCALCSMKLGGYCPGCGGGAGNQGCAIARCNIEHENCEYCYECKNYPCKKYDNITEYDSFITHRNQIADLKKAKNIGLDAYHEELKEKVQILNFLLENYNDGRRKTLFCLAVNLLDLDDLKMILQQIENETSNNDSMKAKALIAVKYLDHMAKQRQIVLKMKKKTKKI